jgi:hypothetical protein
MDRLPPDFADSKQILGKYRTLPDALKALTNAERLVGKKMDGLIKIPGALKDGATDAEKADHATSMEAYRKAIGIPDKPEGYTLKPEKLPEGMEWNEEFGKTFAGIAHKHNVTPDAMKELVEAYTGMEQSRGVAQQQVFQQELEKGKATLQDAWKGDFETNLKVATRVAKTLGLDPNSPGLSDPNVVIALKNMAGMVSEDKLINGEFSGSSTPGKDRGMAIMTGKSSDPEILRLHALYMKGDKEANKTVEELLKNG